MKQVLEQYASAIIATWIALILITVLINGSFFQGKGIAQILGQVVEYSIGEKTVLENEAFENYMSYIPPTIREKDVYIVKGQSVCLSDCFEAKSNQGELLPVYVKKIWDETGREVNAQLSVDTSQINISRTGSYWLHIYAEDKNNRVCERVVRLLVNER